MVLSVSAVVDAECRGRAARPLADVVSHMENVSWMFSSAQQPVTGEAVSTQLSRLSIADTDVCKAAQLWFWATCPIIRLHSWCVHGAQYTTISESKDRQDSITLLINEC